MMTFDLQTPAGEIQPVRDFTTELDGYVYRLVLVYRSRQSRWFLDLYGPDGQALVRMVPLVPNRPALNRRTGYPWPSGILALVDQAGTDDAATVETLGTHHELIYVTAAEVQAWLDEIEPTEAETFTVIYGGGGGGGGS